MKMFPTIEAKAAAYAAMMELKRMLDADGELPHGCNYDLSGVTVQVTIQPGVSVYREEGLNKDGMIEKTATQNLYGYAILAECFRFAKMFKQHKKLERSLMKLVRRALNRAISTKAAFRELMPRQAAAIEELKDGLNIPKREEQTPRMVERKNDKLWPTVAITPARRKVG